PTDCAVWREPPILEGRGPAPWVGAPARGGCGFVCRRAVGQLPVMSVPGRLRQPPRPVGAGWRARQSRAAHLTAMGRDAPADAANLTRTPAARLAQGLSRPMHLGRAGGRVADAHPGTSYPRMQAFAYVVSVTPSIEVHGPPRFVTAKKNPRRAIVVQASKNL